MCVCDLFEESVLAQQTSNKHTIAQESKGFQLVLETTLNEKIFKEEIVRHHSRSDTHAPFGSKAGKKLFARGYRGYCKSTLILYLMMAMMMMMMMM